jgi:uncharacterized protein (UPF0210 family)
MDISKLNKTVEKYERECNAIAEKLEMAKQNLIDDPTDESRLKAIRNLESQLADWESLLQASKQAVKKQQEADELAKEKAMIEECKRLRSEADKQVDVALKAIKEVLNATEAVKANVTKVESMAGINHRELQFGDVMKYRSMLDLRKRLANWASAFDFEASMQDMIEKGLWR